MNSRFNPIHYKQLLFIGGIALAGLLTACQAPPETHPEAHHSLAEEGIVQLTAEAAQTSGIQTATVQSRPQRDELLTTGTVRPNENRVFHINSFVSGRLIQDRAKLGDFVRKGQILAVVQNLEVAKIQAEYIHQLHQNEIDVNKAKIRLDLAKKNLEREKRLLEEGISPRKDYQQADAEATMARAELEGQQEHAVHLHSEAKALLGVYGLKPGQPTSERIRTSSPIATPQAGRIIRKTITVGDMVNPETVLYEVADLSQMWLDITLYPKDISRVRKSQPVVFSTDALPGKQFLGHIDYISPGTVESSHTYLARAYLDNSSGLLQPGMFGQIRIAQGVAPSKAGVPFVEKAAIQQYGREHFVFIPLGNHRFKKQTVRLGEATESGYFIQQGLSVGDTVVGPGSFTLKSELLKSQFAHEGH